MKPHVRKHSILALAVAAAAAASGAQAQLALEEVIVTAQKRTESLQDVPISVVSLGQEALEMRGIDDLKDIGAEIPNLYINPFNNDPTTVRLFIRGIGQNDVQITQDPSVALYTDGVYIGTSVGAGFEGVDIERIEVLRGPQGTLYGRNATGGAVNIVTRRASTEKFEFRQDFTSGNMGKTAYKTVVNVPLSDQFAIKAAYSDSERDGYVKNNGLGEDFGVEDRRTLVADARWEASDNVTVDYRYENAKNKDTQRLEQVLKVEDLGGASPLLPLTTFTDDVSEGFLDEVTSFRPIVPNDMEIEAHGLNIEWSINDNLTFRSITSMRELDNLSSGDALATASGDYTFITGFSGAPNVGVFDLEYEQSSQEFQLIGDMDNLKYVLGLYYYKDEATMDGTAGTTLGASGSTDITQTQNESLAAFAQASWRPGILDERLEVTLGARISKDERKAERNNQRASVPFSGSYDNDFDNFNPSLTIAYDVNDDINVYGKVVSGYKSGGTSTRSANKDLFARGFEEEDILSYELGLKGDLLENRARVNAALFYTELDGLQTSLQTDPFNPGGRDFLPIDNNEAFGFEVDMTFLISEGLTLSAGYGYLDAELGADSVDSGTSAGVFDLIDTFAPSTEHSYSLSLDYIHPVSIGELLFNVNYGWQDETNTSVNLADNTVIDSYGLLGAAITWSDVELPEMPGSLRFMLWGRNLTDEEYGLVNTAAWSFFGASAVQTFGDPRTYGVTVSYRY